MKVDIGRYPNQIRRIKIHEWDCWSVDWTLAQIIEPMIKRIMADKRGIPGCMFEDKNIEYTDEEFAKAEHRWNEILEKIRWAMYEIGHSEPNQPERKRSNIGSRRGDWAKFIQKLKTPISKEEKADLDEFSEKSKAYNNRIQEGCELFGKYFQNLWT
jgi:hypothetical protein